MPRERKRELLQLPGVVSVGEGTENGQTVVVITIEHDAPDVPDGLPDQVHGLPVRIEFGSAIDIEAKDIPVVSTQNAGRIRPVQPGTSTSNAMLGGTGTIGPLMQDGNQLYLISNWHVWSDDEASHDDPLIQPGGIDGGGSRDQVGSYRGAADEWGHLDLAYGVPVDGVGVSSEIYGIGDPTGSRSPSVGDPISKSGRTTGVTHGQVTQIDVSVRVADTDRVLDGQVMADIHSDGGDSGSPVVHSDTLEVVGMNWGGGDNTMVFNDITDIESWLGASVATGIGDGGGSTPEPNEPPDPDVSFLVDGLTVHFDATGSSDPDGEIVEYAWDFDYDGQNFNVDATGAQVSHTYASGGQKQAAMEVTDDDGERSGVAMMFSVSEPVDPCDGVTCGTGEECVEGDCIVVDPCAGVTCGDGEVCDGGECVSDPSNPCESVSCPDGDICDAGECVPSPDCMYRGHPRSEWGYVGSDTVDFQAWSDCAMSTEDFQRLTPPGEGTAALVPPEDSGGLNERMVIGLALVAGLVYVSGRGK